MPYRRIQFATGQYYHIYNRGSGGRAIFRERKNYAFLLGRIKEYADAFHVAVIAYCLMPNHYHLLLRQDGQEPAGLLPQRVFNSYTKAFNKRYGASGTLFESRFKAIHVDQNDYLLHLCRYIHTPWVFQLLRGGGQLCQFEAVFLASNADTVQMAKPAQPATQFQLARVPGAPEALSSRTNTDCRAAKGEKSGKKLFLGES